MELELIRSIDPQVAEAIDLELNRQRTHIVGKLGPWSQLQSSTKRCHRHLLHHSAAMPQHDIVAQFMAKCRQQQHCQSLRGGQRRKQYQHRHCSRCDLNRCALTQHSKSG